MWLGYEKPTWQRGSVLQIDSYDLVEEYCIRNNIVDDYHCSEVAAHRARRGDKRRVEYQC